MTLRCGERRQQEGPGRDERTKYDEEREGRGGRATHLDVPGSGLLQCSVVLGRHHFPPALGAPFLPFLVVVTGSGGGASR